MQPMETSKRKVVLAGAGPGDPDLISLKALKAIQCAEVILYDALVNKELLKNAPTACKLVYVGKRKGKKEFSQEEINDLIVFYSCRFKNVLRLKGGDPYVFGRGHEELEYIIRRGIDVEVIPGISSAIAAPASVGIPLTKRGVNESFWVITGMLSSGEFSSDLYLAAKSSATIIILMGVTHLPEIMKLFAKFRSGYEPVAVIQNACRENQKSVVGDASNIAGLVRRHGIEAPAVIVVGQVVNESNISEILLREEVKMKVAV
jgi:uroporphyrin-III C-methyltransferase